MPRVESAADRAAMFSADEFGTAALYTPPTGGPGIACHVILDLGRTQDFEAEFGRGGGRGSIARQRAQFLADEVAVVAQGGTVAVQFGVEHWDALVSADQTYRIPSRPDLDETGAIWTADLQEV